MRPDTREAPPSEPKLGRRGYPGDLSTTLDVYAHAVEGGGEAAAAAMLELRVAATGA